MNAMITAQINTLNTLTSADQTGCDFAAFSVCAGALLNLVKMDDMQAAVDQLGGLLGGFRSASDKYKDAELDGAALPTDIAAKNAQIKSVVSTANSLSQILLRLAIPEDTAGRSLVSADGKVHVKASVLKGASLQLRFQQEKIRVFELQTPPPATRVIRRRALWAGALPQRNPATLPRRHLATIDANANYEIIEIVFQQNPFAFDGKFPYPASQFPVIQVSVKQAGGAALTDLPFALSFYFNATEVAALTQRVQADNPKYVCIQQKPDQSWTSEYCLSTITAGIVECACKYASATTVTSFFALHGGGG